MNHPLQNWLEWAALSTAARVVRNWNYPLLESASKLLGSLVWACDAKGRRTSMQNLEAAFPGQRTALQKRRIARGSYVSFARTMLEVFWAPNVTLEFVRRHIVFEGLGREEQAAGRPAIYCCMHFGNFEWLALVGALTITRGPVIAQRFRNPLLGPVFDSLRASAGSQVIPQERAMLRMLKHLKSGGKFGMLIDLNLDPREGSVPVKTFGGLIASVTQMHVAVAQRTGASVIPIECVPSPGGYPKIVVHPGFACPPEEDSAALVQRCWDALEPSIHAQPEYWLWSYKHWRFRPSGDSGRYPAYANPSKRFDDLLARHGMA